LSVVFLFLETRIDEPILPLSLFKNRVIWTAAACAMILSVAMYGTTLFIPLFLQAVIGRSATQSGAVLMPLMGSMIASSVTSGQIITRAGRYRVIAIFGAVVTFVGLVLLSRMTIATEYSTTVRNMIVMGIGMGCTFPVFTIAAQNAVGPELVGVATSSIQFLRSMGGSLGAAAFGAVLTNRFATVYHGALSPDITQRVSPSLVATFENPQALMNPRIANQLKAAGPEMLQQLEPLLEAVKHGLVVALQNVFVAAASLMILGIVISVMLIDLPLRTSNRRDAVSEVEADTARAGMPSFEI
jgi:hypothetical protein